MGSKPRKTTSKKRAAKQPKLALCMIVKDEADTIGPLLDSAAAAGIDYWVILDTGSTDDTEQVVKERLETAYGITGEFHHGNDFKGFGPSRTDLMQLARGKAEWLLLLDADDELGQPDKLEPLLSEQQADAINIRYATGVEHYLPRVVRGSKPWRFVGACHAYLDCDEPFTQSKAEQPHVIHRGADKPRPERFERNLQLLAVELAKNPDDSRSAFYLANTLRDLGQHEAAAPAYRKRAEMGGWPEEVWESLFQEGMARHSEDILLEAYHYRPSRAEPLYWLAMWALEAGEPHKAAFYARLGVSVPYPEQDVLFVNRPIYEGAMQQLLNTAWERMDERAPAKVALKLEMAKRMVAQQQKALDSVRAKSGMTPNKVSAVIVTRGDVDLEPILKTLPYDEVIVWDNSKRPEGDLGTYGRYVAMRQAKHRVIYTQDDDLVFAHHQALLDAYEPGLIVTNMPSPWYENMGYDKLGQCQVGGGAVFDRDVVWPMIEGYLEEWPEDDFFRLRCDEIVGFSPHRRLDLGFQTRPEAEAEGRLSTVEGWLDGKNAMRERAAAIRAARNA